MAIKALLSKDRVRQIVFSTPMDILVGGCIVLSVSLLFLDTHHISYPLVKRFTLTLEWFLHVFFVVEYVIKAWSSVDRKQFFKAYLIDLVALLPLFRIFRFFRLLRLVRLLHIVKINRLIDQVTTRLTLFLSSIEKRVSEAIIVGSLLVMVLLFGTVGILIFERGINDQFSSIMDGFWWSMVTLTTVGYGDKFPVTVGGRFIAMFVMFVGLGVFALLTSLISTFLMGIYKRGEKKSMSISGVQNHHVLCGWSSKGKTIIKELKHLYEGTEIVLVCDTLVDDLPSDVHLYKGDFTSPESLNKVNILEATSVIIIGDCASGRSQQDADARTVLTALAIQQIHPELGISAEVYSEHNARLLTKIGVRDVILSSSYTGNLLAQSVKYPGMTEVFSELLQSTLGNSILQVPCPDNLVERDYQESVIELLSTENKVVIGLCRDRAYTINPKEAFKLKKSDSLVVIG